MVLIAIPTTGDVRYSLVERLLDYKENFEDVEVFLSNDMPVDSNRCAIVDYFMKETDHDELIMIDDDIIPPENLLDVLDYDKKIVSPIVFSMRDGVPYPVATIEKEDGRLTQFVGDMDELQKVDATGTGCIKISREVFEGIDKPYFEFTKNEDGSINTGEDFNFCLKAKENGYNVYVATDYVAGHMKKMDLRHIMELMNLALEADKSEIYLEEV